MATFKNPDNARRDLSVLAQGVVGYNRFTFDLSASYATGAGADESLIEIGFVPPDCKLIPYLSRLSIPQLDSNGGPTGDYEVGITGSTAALKAAAAAETAVVLSGEDFIDADIGSQTAAVPVYLRVSNVIATLGTGTITFDVAYRAWNSDLD